MGDNLQVTKSLVEELSPLASETVGRDRADVGHERARLLAERFAMIHWLITLSEEVMADVSKIRVECTSLSVLLLSGEAPRVSSERF